MGRALISAGSVPVLERPEEDAPLVTELIVGEALVALGEAGAGDGWLRVVVPGHATALDARGYPGWARPDGLVERPGWNPRLTVVAPNGAGLPLGARLGEDGALPGGGTADVRPPCVGHSGEPVKTSPVEISSGLLGLPYRWGGTDSTVGMDCSGLVFRVMELLGVIVPRDADDQFARAPYKSRESWEEADKGDLVFFGEGSVTHVGFYLGDGTYLSEHGSSGAVVRGMDEDPYWGFARYP